MGEKINYTLTASLKRTALVKIAVALCYRDDAIGIAFRSLDRYKIERKWYLVEDLMFERVLKLPLPELLKKELSRFVAAASQQIIQWIMDSNDPISTKIARKGLNRFCWTPQGTIDKKKTVELFVRDESLDIVERFKLACTYCLEDDIPVLWEQLDESIKGNLKHTRIREEPLVPFWSHFIEGEIAQLDDIMRRVCENNYASHYEFAFRCSALGTNDTAAKYFFKHLTPNEKERTLVKTAVNILKKEYGYLHILNPGFTYSSNILCFLLSHMNEEQQLEVFKSEPLSTLMTFLEWPWQDFFIETAQRMCIFLPEEEYYWVIRYIIDYKIWPRFKDYNYQKLIGLYWQQSPISQKRYLINESFMEFTGIISNLLEIEDAENVKLIFNDAAFGERDKFIFSNVGQKFCRYMISCGRFEVLKFFFKECISSKNEILKFKSLVTNPSSSEGFKIKKNKEKFFKLLDDLIYESDETENI